MSKQNTVWGQAYTRHGKRVCSAYLSGFRACLEEGDGFWDYYVVNANTYELLASGSTQNEEAAKDKAISIIQDRLSGETAVSTMIWTGAPDEPQEIRREVARPPKKPVAPVPLSKIRSLIDKVKWLGHPGGRMAYYTAYVGKYRVVVHQPGLGDPEWLWEVSTYDPSVDGSYFLVDSGSCEGGHTMSRISAIMRIVRVEGEEWLDNILSQHPGVEAKTSSSEPPCKESLPESVPEIQAGLYAEFAKNKVLDDTSKVYYHSTPVMPSDAKWYKLWKVDEELKDETEKRKGPITFLEGFESDGFTAFIAKDWGVDHNGPHAPGADEEEKELEAEAKRLQSMRLELDRLFSDLKWQCTHDGGVYTFVGQYKLAVRPRRVDGRTIRSHPWEHAWYVTELVATPSGFPNNKVPVDNGLFDGSIKEAKKKAFDALVLEIGPEKVIDLLSRRAPKELEDDEGRQYALIDILLKMPWTERNEQNYTQRTLIIGDWLMSATCSWTGRATWSVRHIPTHKGHLGPVLEGSTIEHAMVHAFNLMERESKKLKTYQARSTEHGKQ